MTHIRHILQPNYTVPKQNTVYGLNPNSTRAPWLCSWGGYVRTHTVQPVGRMHVAALCGCHPDHSTIGVFFPVAPVSPHSLGENSQWIQGHVASLIPSPVDGPIASPWSTAL